VRSSVWIKVLNCQYSRGLWSGRSKVLGAVRLQFMWFGWRIVQTRVVV
jgi:hypothetical protein